MVKDFWVQVLHHNREWICMDKTRNTLITHTCLPNNSNSKSLLARWDIKVQVDMIVVVDIKPHTVEIHRSEGEKAKGIHTNHIGTRLPDKDMLMVAVWRTCEWHPHILSLRLRCFQIWFSCSYPFSSPLFFYWETMHIENVIFTESNIRFLLLFLFCLLYPCG